MKRDIFIFTLFATFIFSISLENQVLSSESCDLAGLQISINGGQDMDLLSPISICEGDNITLRIWPPTICVSPCVDPQYTWMNSSNIVQESNLSTLTLNNVTLNDTGSYSVQINGPSGCSSNKLFFTLIVFPNDASVIIRPGDNITIGKGKKLCQLCAIPQINGNDDLKGAYSYSWTKDGQPFADTQCISDKPSLKNSPHIYSVTVTNCGGCETNASATVNVVSYPRPHLSISKCFNLDAVKLIGTYTIDVVNYGNADAHGVNVIDFLPACISDFSVVNVPTGWGSKIVDGVVTFNNPSFHAGDKASFTINVNVQNCASDKDCLNTKSVIESSNAKGHSVSNCICFTAFP